MHVIMTVPPLPQHSVLSPEVLNPVPYAVI